MSPSKRDELFQKLGLSSVTGASTGQWLTLSGSELVSSNPSTGEPLGTVRVATEGAYEGVIAAAQKRFLEWRMRPAPKRGEVIRALGEALRQFKEPLGELVSLEVGKIRSEGLGEVQEMIDICDFAVGLSRQLYGLTIASERPQHRMFEQWHPMGVCGVVTAFNFPVAVWAWNAALAAVCGDTVVWKPSPHAPFCALAVQQICHRVMKEHDAEGLFGLVIDGSQLGQRLAADPRVPLVSFTGSSAIGRQVAATVAGRFGKSILELGGNNAIIALQDADLDLTARAITFGAVGTAGQRCTTTRRVYAHHSIADRLVERLIKAYRSVRIGDPLEQGTLLGPLISAEAVNRYRAAIEQAQAQGGKLVCGGKVVDRPGHFVEPSIIRVPAGAKLEIAKTETFAPILYVFEIESLESAIAAQNDVPQGLSSAIFTDSLRAAETFLSPLGSDCGIANVNLGTSGAEIGGAFGGEKETGGGRESGSDAWKGYMRRQTCTVNWSRQLPLAQGVQFDAG